VQRELIQREAFVPICVARGPKWQLRANLQKQEARGDITVLWDQAQDRHGFSTIPYVRRRTLAQIRRRRAARGASYAGSALLSLAGIGWALYDARHVIAAALLALVAAGGIVCVVMLLSHPQGCVCPVCGMRLH
jgi:hypothetical protein